MNDILERMIIKLLHVAINTATWYVTHYVPSPRFKNIYTALIDVQAEVWKI